MEIDPLEDIRILVLLFKMGAKTKPAQITRHEWIAGCSALNIQSVESLKSLLPSLDPGFMNHNQFRELYKVRDRYGLFTLQISYYLILSQS